MNQINSDFRKYYSQYKQRVFYAANSILNHKEAAEDVTSEVFISLYKQMLVREIPENKLAPWLLISAKRRAYNYIRDNKRFVSLDPETPEGSFSPKSDDRIFVSDMLNRLHKRNPKWFDTIVDFYLLEMSAAEIAKENHCSEQSVRNTLQRARDYLREEYKKVSGKKR